MDVAGTEISSRKIRQLAHSMQSVERFARLVDLGERVIGLAPMPEKRLVFFARILRAVHAFENARELKVREYRVGFRGLKARLSRGAERSGSHEGIAR